MCPTPLNSDECSGREACIPLTVAGRSSLYMSEHMNSTNPVQELMTMPCRYAPYTWLFTAALPEHHVTAAHTCKRLHPSLVLQNVAPTSLAFLAVIPMRYLKPMLLQDWVSRLRLEQCMHSQALQDVSPTSRERLFKALIAFLGHRARHVCCRMWCQSCAGSSVGRHPCFGLL
jgi:hypothetical protein